MSTSSTDRHDRLINLMFAFLDAAKTGKTLTVEGIQHNVPGYLRTAEGKIRTMRTLSQLVHRDIEKLKAIGVPIETQYKNGLSHWCIVENESQLPAINFTPEESTVLSLAGKRGTAGELSTFVQSGWIKIASGGAQADLTQHIQFTAHSDIDAISEHDLSTIISACKQQHRLGFYFQRTPASDYEPRWIDPWGLVTHNKRLYLVGYDQQRQAPRSFRFTKISELEAYDSSDEECAEYGEFYPQREDVDIYQIVQQQLYGNITHVTATIDIAPGHGNTLVQRAAHSEGTLHTLVDIPAQWVLRESLRYAPHAIIVSPPELRRQAQHILRAALTQKDNDE